MSGDLLTGDPDPTGQAFRFILQGVHIFHEDFEARITLLFAGGDIEDRRQQQLRTANHVLDVHAFGNVARQMVFRIGIGPGPPINHGLAKTRIDEHAVIRSRVP